MQSYLYISYKCNCNCFFCASDQTNFIKEGNEVTLEEAKRFILNSPNKTSLIISGGEPTIHKNIIDIIRFAKLHFKHVSMMTNALKFSNLSFLKTLIDSGVDGFYVPFYSSEESMYNYLVGNERAFENYIQGLSNLNDLLFNYNFKVVIKLLLAKFTYKTNPQSIKYLATHFPNIKNISLYGFHISDKAVKRADECIMSYSESRLYNDLTIQYFVEYGYDFHICEIPLCAFSNRTIHYLLQSGKVAYSDKTFLKRPDWKTAVVSPPFYLPKECNKCALMELCPKIPAKNASQFDFGIRPILFTD